MGAKVMHEFVAGLAANFQDNRETSSLGVGTIAFFMTGRLHAPVRSLHSLTTASRRTWLHDWLQFERTVTPLVPLLASLAQRNSDSGAQDRKLSRLLFKEPCTTWRKRLQKSRNQRVASFRVINISSQRGCSDNSFWRPLRP